MDSRFDDPVSWWILMRASYESLSMYFRILIVYWDLSMINEEAYSFNAVDATCEDAPYFFSHCFTRASISSHIAIMARGSNPAGSPFSSSLMKWLKSFGIAILNTSTNQSTPASTGWSNYTFYQFITCDKPLPKSHERSRSEIFMNRLANP